MKTIIESATRISKYIFEDGVSLDVQSKQIITPDFVIGDMGSDNAEVIESVIPPADWFGCKYLFTELNEWELNPYFVVPEE
jgi:hypothetical protein